MGYTNQYGRKVGPWTEDEKAYIIDNCDEMHYEQIAEKLSRNPKSVKDYIRKILGKEPKISIEVSAEQAIKKTPIWKELKQQFTDDELKMFTYHWGRIVNQFKEDVLPTEEMQVIDYVRLEILISRILIQQQKNTSEIIIFEGELEQERAKTPKDDLRILQLGDQITQRRMAQQSISSDHIKLIEKKTSILDKMKGTREARIKMLESSKETMLGWIKDIINNNSTRNRLGLQMAKMRIAMKQEEKRLTELHTYADGQKDIPILSAKTVEEQEVDFWPLIENSNVEPAGE